MVVPATEVRVSFPAPATHLLHVAVRTRALMAGAHEFFMPVWTPGSYLVREFSRHVEGMTARDGAGRPLPVSKSAKNRWRVELAAPGDVELAYRVYARDLTVRTNYVDAQRAYWNGAATYVVHVDRRDAPVRIEVEAPEGAGVHVGLPRLEGAFVAATYDLAIDAPFLVGRIPTTSFEVAGIRHTCVWDGLPSREMAALTRDVEAMVRVAAEIFDGRLPYPHYVFLVFVDAAGSGGLEHADSCVIHVRRDALRKPDERLRILGLFAHEHFHAWNVKRIRPIELRTFDYESENYTRDLWLAEGFTTYYQEVIPYRAGLYTRDVFLDHLARNWSEVTATPGRKLHSVAEASFDAWIKLYRPDEMTRSTTISYYGKGAVVAFCLDLLIQARSRGRHSLDDVMRGLFAHYEQHGPGQSRQLVEELVEAAAGSDLSQELALLVDGTEDPPITEWLQPFGLAYAPPTGGSEPSLDITVRVTDGVARIASVDRGGAGWQMGLSPDDEPIAINGERLAGDQLASVVRDELTPGDEVEIHVFRRGLLTAVRGKVGARTKGTPRLVESPSELRFRAPAGAR